MIGDNYCPRCGKPATVYHLMPFIPQPETFCQCNIKPITTNKSKCDHNNSLSRVEGGSVCYICYEFIPD